MKLNRGQEDAVSAICAGRNVFLTGEGGTGKSVALSEAVARLGRRGVRAVVCAPTGIAAQQVGGATIHSAFRFDLAPKVADALGGLSPSKVISGADCIIIDEIGMVRRDLMDAIAKVVGDVNEARAAARERGEEAPGPLQVVAVGDFSQLPPVATKNDLPALEAWYGNGCGLYAFEAEGWDRLGFECHMLSEPMRQRGDDGFVAMLNRARVGDASCLGYFNRLVIDERGEAPDGAVVLVGTNRRAEAMNRARLDALKGRAKAYEGTVSGEFREADMASPKTLTLKVGARVIITANSERGGEEYVNGSTGTVSSLTGKNEAGVPCIDVSLDRGGTAKVVPHAWENTRYRVEGKGPSRRLVQETVGTFTQYPLKLAWAITYHKSQGQTLDLVSIDPSTFAPGQLYVGLSRATSASGIWLTRPIGEDDLAADAGVVAFYRGLGWEAPPPAGGELPDLETKPDTVADCGPATSDAGSMGMGEIMGELLSLLAQGSRAWVRVYELMASVAERGLFRPEFRSYSAWLRDLAARTGVTEGLLWHRKSAGDWYTAWAAEHPGAPSLADGSGLSEENLNIIRKISASDRTRANELMADITAGSVSTKSLRREWREMRRRENDAGSAAEAAPVAAVNRGSMTVECADAAAFERVIEALRAAGIELVGEL